MVDNRIEVDVAISDLISLIRHGGQPLTSPSSSQACAPGEDNGSAVEMVTSNDDEKPAVPTPDEGPAVVAQEGDRVDALMEAVRAVVARSVQGSRLPLSLLVDQAISDLEAAADRVRACDPSSASSEASADGSKGGDFDVVEGSEETVAVGAAAEVGLAEIPCDDCDGDNDAAMDACLDALDAAPGRSIEADVTSSVEDGRQSAYPEPPTNHPSDGNVEVPAENAAISLSSSSSSSNVDVQGPLSPDGRQALEWALQMIEGLAEASVLGEEIKALTVREAYGQRGKAALAYEDVEPVALWRWEINRASFFSKGAQAVIKEVRLARKRYGQAVRAYWRVIEQINKTPDDEAKVSKCFCLIACCWFVVFDVRALVALPKQLHSLF